MKNINKKKDFILCLHPGSNGMTQEEEKETRKNQKEKKKEDFIPASTQGEEKERRKRENKKIFDASIPRYNGTKNGGKDKTHKNKMREEEI